MNVYVPALVGVPEIMPVSLSNFRPFGRVKPSSTLQTIVPAPEAARAVLYGEYVDASLSFAVTISTCSAEPSVMTRVYCCAVTYFSLEASTMNVYVPAVVGMPRISPVASSRVSPAGSEPSAMSKLISEDDFASI